MTVQLTAVNILVLLAMGAYLAAAAALVLRARRAGWAFFTAAFGASTAAFVLRWIEVGHVPMQNLYEVFITMGMLMLPISVFSRRVLKVGGEAADALTGVVVLFPVAFVIDPEPRDLMPALQSPLFGPHVATYLLAYIILLKASVQALGRLFVGEGPRDERVAPYDPACYRMVCLGFPLLTLGLVLGAWWAKLAWSDYWNWDPKDLWSLVSWLTFLGYLHFRAAYGGRLARVNAALVVAGAVCILITLLLANLSKLFAGLHSYA